MNYISLIHAVTGVNYAPYYKWTENGELLGELTYNKPHYQYL